MCVIVYLEQGFWNWCPQDGSGGADFVAFYKTDTLL